jgi:hypothetical protein
MKLTAIEWLLENLISEPYFEHDIEHNKNCWDKAKEMERGHAQLYAIFCIRCITENLPVIRFEDFIKLEGGEK